MRLLLDTHTYLWLRLEPHKLSRKVVSLVKDRENELLLSLVSLWEMTIKASKGQLRLPAASIREVRDELDDFGIELLGVDAVDISVLETLPHNHRDPFDRLLIAQAMRHGLTLLTDDGMVSGYDIAVLWK